VTKLNNFLFGFFRYGDHGLLWSVSAGYGQFLLFIDKNLENGSKVSSLAQK
jgi:hypothetical protein